MVWPHPTIRCGAPARPCTRSRSPGAKASPGSRARCHPARRRDEPRHEVGAIRPAIAPPALADGRHAAGHALHRRGHGGLTRRLPPAGRAPSTTRHRAPDPGHRPADQPPVQHAAAVSIDPGLVGAHGRHRQRAVALCAHARSAARGLGDALGGALSDRPVRPGAPAADPAALANAVRRAPPHAYDPRPSAVPDVPGPPVGRAVPHDRHARPLAGPHGHLAGPGLPEAAGAPRGGRLAVRAARGARRRWPLTSQVIEDDRWRGHHGFVPSATTLIVTLAVLLGAGAGARGLRLLARGLRHDDDPDAPLWIVRGLRGVIVGLCMGALSAGVVFEQVWLIVFGAVWLAEEIYETGVLALILRSGAKPADRWDKDVGAARPPPLAPPAEIRRSPGGSPDVAC